MSQAKGATSTQSVVEQMQLEDPELVDRERIHEMVTYDVVPEIELYMHQTVKDLHSSLDEQRDGFANGREDEESSDDEDPDEETKGGDEEREARREARRQQKQVRATAQQQM